MLFLDSSSPLTCWSMSHEIACRHCTPSFFSAMRGVSIPVQSSRNMLPEPTMTPLCHRPVSLMFIGLSRGKKWSCIRIWAHLSKTWDNVLPLLVVATATTSLPPMISIQGHSWKMMMMMMMMKMMMQRMMVMVMMLRTMIWVHEHLFGLRFVEPRP